MLVSAPAARRRQRVVKMKPEAKLRMKSQIVAEGGHIAADHTECLRQRAFDHGQTVARSFAVGDTPAPGP